MTTPRIMVDSGAFTVSRQGEAIEVRDYIKFVRRNLALIRHAVNLDVIPDRGMDRDQIRSAAKHSWENQQEMKSAGLSPLPVVHQPDGPDWLERYLDAQEPYIALAPKGHGSLNWLFQCFRILKQASYSPQVHGLAVTNTLQLLNFPWSSVDSATWVKQAAVGHVLVPLFDSTDQPLFDLRPDGVFVTDRMKVESNHIDRLPQYKLDDLRRFIVEYCDLNLADVRSDNRARCRALIRYFRGVEAAAKVRLFFVSNVGTHARNQLIQCGARDHLLSYAALRRVRDGALQRYVEGHT